MLVAPAARVASDPLLGRASSHSITHPVHCDGYRGLEHATE
jgi:hypothetical protein